MTVAFFSLPLRKLWQFFFFCLFIFCVSVLLLSVINYDCYYCLRTVDFSVLRSVSIAPLAKGHLPCFSGSLLDEINLLFTVFTVVGVCVRMSVCERMSVCVCVWAYVCVRVCVSICLCECVCVRVYVMNKNLCMVQRNVIKSLVSTAYRCSQKPKLQTFTDQYNVQRISQNGDTSTQQ